MPQAAKTYGHKPKLGIIGEDKTDCKTIHEFAKRFVEDVSVSFYSAKGGSNIHKKASQWMQFLAKDQCTHIVILHDLDRRDSGALNNENPKLAKQLDVDLCAKRCPSFHELREFLKTLRSTPT